MKIIKRSSTTIIKEPAHGGSGVRKMYASAAHLKSPHFEAMVQTWLPAGNTFDWHEHTDTEEIMVVVKGSGSVFDEDGEYPYEPGDAFIFPANTQHKIMNTSGEDHEMFFVRVRT